MEQRRVRLEIYGKVQGVFFRDTTRKKARKMGLSGWVKNRPDGSVEALIEGPEEEVESLVQWAHQGPSRARVEDVHVTDEKYRGDQNGFRVER